MAERRRREQCGTSGVGPQSPQPWEEAAAGAGARLDLLRVRVEEGGRGGEALEEGGDGVVLRGPAGDAGHEDAGAEELPGVHCVELLADTGRTRVGHAGRRRLSGAGPERRAGGRAWGTGGRACMSWRGEGGGGVLRRLRTNVSQSPVEHVTCGGTAPIQRAMKIYNIFRFARSLPRRALSPQRRAASAFHLHSPLPGLGAGSCNGEIRRARTRRHAVRSPVMSAVRPPFRQGRTSSSALRVWASHSRASSRMSRLTTGAPLTLAGRGFCAAGGKATSAKCDGGHQAEALPSTGRTLASSSSLDSYMSIPSGISACAPWRRADRRISRSPAGSARSCRKVRPGCRHGGREGVRSCGRRPDAPEEARAAQDTALHPDRAPLLVLADSGAQFSRREAGTPARLFHSLLRRLGRLFLWAEVFRSVQQPHSRHHLHVAPNVVRALALELCSLILANGGNGIMSGGRHCASAPGRAQTARLTLSAAPATARREWVRRAPFGATSGFRVPQSSLGGAAGIAGGTCANSASADASLIHSSAFPGVTSASSVTVSDNF